MSFPTDVHRRDNRESKVPETALVVPIPDVFSISDFYRVFLVEEQILSRIKAEKKAQSLKMKALVEYVKNELLKTDKKKTLFNVPATQEATFGSCSGLRLAKKTRREVFNDTKMEEVTIKATATVFKDCVPEQMLAAYGKRLADEIQNARTPKITYEIARLLPKGASAKNPHKRQRKLEPQ